MADMLLSLQAPQSAGAGIASKGDVFGATEAQETLDTNFYGTKRVCEALAPLMENGGRIVNVCSMAGKQRILKSASLLQKFQVGVIAVAAAAAAAWCTVWSRADHRLVKLQLCSRAERKASRP